MARSWNLGTQRARQLHLCRLSQHTDSERRFLYISSTFHLLSSEDFAHIKTSPGIASLLLIDF